MQFLSQGILESHIIQESPQKRFIGKDEEDGCLCSEEKQHRTEQEEGLIQSFLEGSTFPSGLDWWDSVTSS